jgi:Transglycosylase SLT domain
MRRGIRAGGLIGAYAVLLLAGAADASSKAKPQLAAAAIKQIIENKAGSIQLVTFPETAWSAVKVLRGAAAASRMTGPKPAAEKAETAEIVSFADPQARPVRVMRGDVDHAAPEPSRAAHIMSMQVVTFADFRDRPVSILRGSVPNTVDTELFGPASAVDLDRVAFAVDGAESSHGTDLGMWRPEPSGPQGPMQVTAAAAIDVGGGDRLDLVENRALGRAYLARLFRRYGNWPDAIAAYNWGPGNVDAWISGGRAAGKLPLVVERYRDRVLRDAVLAEQATQGR